MPVNPLKSVQEIFNLIYNATIQAIKTIAVGPVSEGSAHGTSAPVQISGEDPTGVVARLQTDASKNLKVDIAASSGDVATPGDGRKTVAVPGTSEPLMAASTPVKWVTIQALRANTDAVTVGASTVVAADGTEQGATLYALSSIPLSNIDLNDIYVDSIQAGEGVSFIYGA